MKLALEVVLGKKTLDQARRQLSATQDYFAWYLNYYLPLADAKRRIDVVKSGEVLVLAANQHLTLVISDIFNTLKQEETTWGPGESMDRNEILDWSLRDHSGRLDNQTIVNLTDQLIGKYVEEVGYDYGGAPTVFASLNQLTNAYTALQKLDKQFKGLGRLTLAVLLGTLSVEDF